MEYTLTALLASENCNDLYTSLAVDDILMQIIKVCRSSNCRDFLELFLQKGNDKANDRDLYIRLSPLALIITVSLGAPYINRFAHKFAKFYVDYYLASASEVEVIKKARDLGLDIEKSDSCFNEVDLYITRRNTIVRICYRYRIHFISYLKAVRTLSSTEVVWSLSATPLYRGYVLIENYEKVMRIFMEYLRNLVSSRIKSIHTLCSNPKGILLSYIDKINSLDQNVGKDVRDFIESLTTSELNIDSRSLNIDRNSLGVKDISIANIANILKDIKTLMLFSESFFPPCIQSILRSLINSENLTHHQRFALATFLINLNASIDDLLQIFRYSPDFNEKVTRYQLEHLAGLRGSKRRYLPYNCLTMKTLGMCNSECNVKSPLQYLYRKIKSRTQ